MINNVVLVGRLTKDVELRYTPSGIPMARFTIAVNRTFTGQNGEREADFIGCIAWRKPAENLANFMKKGSLIGVEGRIQTGSYDGQDGKKIYTTDVIADAIQFLEPRGDSTGQAPQTQQEQQPPRQQQQPQYEQQYSNPQAAQQAGQQAHQQQYQQPQQQYQQPQQRTSDDDLPY